MQICLIPLMGPFHLRYPSYNAQSVRDLLESLNPDAVAISALSEGDLSNPSWQHTAEIALPLSVMPWLKKQNINTQLIHEPSPDPSAQQDFMRLASEYPQLGQKISEANLHLRPLNNLLGETLSLKRINTEVLPLLKTYQEQREDLLEEGPATDWLHTRVKTMAQRILELKENRIAVLASIDHIPYLQDELQGKVDWLELPELVQTDASTERSIMDFAFRGDVPEPGNLIARLRKIDKPEARYHEANLLLMNAHLLEALDVLEKASQTNFSDPYYLPGYLLSRLGQVYDLVENRKASLRSYKGALALDFTPQEALQAAQEGLEKPFGQS